MNLRACTLARTIDFCFHPFDPFEHCLSSNTFARHHLTWLLPCCCSLSVVLADLMLDSPLVARMLVRLDIGVHWPNVAFRVTSLPYQGLRGICGQVLNVVLSLIAY